MRERREEWGREKDQGEVITSESHQYTQPGWVTESNLQLTTNAIVVS